MKILDVVLALGVLFKGLYVLAGQLVALAWVCFWFWVLWRVAT